MSHFTVLVVGNDPDKQLAPFQENNMDDCPKEYLTFNDATEECIKGYLTDTRTMVRLDNGKMIDDDDAMFQVVNPEINERMFKPKIRVIPKHLDIITLPIWTEYTTIKDYVEKYCGYKLDGKTGRYGYWENPNRKWDWYEIGGRWEGFFILKNREHSDQALKGDIDFDAMRKDAGDNAGRDWDRVNLYITKDTRRWFKAWPIFRDKYYPESINRARVEYHRQAALTILKEKGVDTWEVEDRIVLTRVQYVQRAMDRAIGTFAVLINGCWCERGKMGFWACVTDEKEDWGEQFNRILDSISDDTLLTVVDCHI